VNDRTYGCSTIHSPLNGLSQNQSCLLSINCYCIYIIIEEDRKAKRGEE